MNFFDSQEAVTAWMNSPLHKENIMNPNYTETGIAMIKSSVPGTGEERIVVVQNFGSQLKSKVAVVKATTQTTKPAPIRTTTTRIASTTTQPSISTTTIPNEVLGLSESNKQEELPPFDARSQEEIEISINQTLITKEQRAELSKLEFARTAFSNNVSETT